MTDYEMERAKQCGAMTAALAIIDGDAKAALECLTSVEGMRGALARIRQQCAVGLEGTPFERFCVDFDDSVTESKDNA
jgi:hypothetical protein